MNEDLAASQQSSKGKEVDYLLQNSQSPDSVEVLPPRGLINLEQTRFVPAKGIYNSTGNACFVISFMQLIFSIPSIQKVFENYEQQHNGILTKSVTKLLQSMEQQDTVTAIQFFSSLENKLGTSFAGRHQQDLKELFVLFTNSLSRECSLPNTVLADLMFAFETAKDNHPLSTLTYSILEKEFTCKEITCKHSFTRLEPSQHLELRFPGTEKNQWESATVKDLLCNSLTGTCERKCCLEDNVVHTETFRFVRPPELLFLFITRDRANGQAPNRTLLHFSETLDIDEFLCENNRGTLTAKLLAYAEHRGEDENGHFICYGKRGEDWFCFNDDSCSIITPEEALQPSKYAVILLYQLTRV